MARIKDRIERIKRVTLRVPYLFSFLIFAFLYVVVNTLTNQVHVTLPVLALQFKIPYIIFHMLIAILTGISINLIIVKFKEIRSMQNSAALTTTGIFGGLLGGACPGCFAGVFPAIAGVFGVQASVNILPFYGLELQVAAIILLSISVYMLTGDVVCKPKKSLKRNR